MDGLHLDPILGLLLPGAGDLVGAGLGLYPLLLAWRHRAPRALLARMLLNLSLDMLSGAVPVLGDIWDFFFRANRRNLQLLRQRAAGGEIAPSRSDGLVVAGAVGLFLTALAVPVVVIWKLLSLLLG
jgi:hypothetical protein